MVEIAEPFRGHRLGLAVVDRLLTHFEDSCGCGLLNAVDRAAETDARAAVGRAALARYWSKLGFADHALDIMTVDFGRPRPAFPGVRVAGTV